MSNLRIRATLATGGALLAGIACLVSYYIFEPSIYLRIGVTFLLILVGIDSQRRATTQYLRPACLFLLGSTVLYALLRGYATLPVTIVSIALVTAVLTLLPDHHPDSLAVRYQIGVALVFTELVMLCSLLPSTPVLQGALATVVISGLLEILRHQRSSWWQIGRPYFLIASALFICDLGSLLIHP